VSARYRALFSVEGYTRLLVSSLLGRLPSGMFSLSILLLVDTRTHSFLDAGLAVGAFTLTGAAGGPFLGALVDRVGQTRVLMPTAAGQAALLTALALVAHGAVATVALAALAGAVQPPIAGCIRALWAQVAGEGEMLESAYALDATTQELIWTLGPLLVGSTATLLSPAAAVLLCAAVTLGGTLFFASSRLSSGWQATAASERSRGGALADPGLRALLGTVLFAGVVIGAVEVGLPVLAAQHGSRWAAGPLLALFSVGSMAGGLLYSARSWRLPIGQRYEVLLLAMAVAVAPLIAVHSIAVVLPLGVIAGLGVAPMLSAQFSLVGTLAAAGTATEAFTWHRAATIAGMAAGSMLAGSLADRYGAGAAFALGSLSLALACLLAWCWRERIDPSGASAPVAALAAPREPAASSAS
jgi:MFS family permease